MLARLATVLACLLAVGSVLAGTAAATSSHAGRGVVHRRVVRAQHRPTIRRCTSRRVRVRGRRRVIRTCRTIAVATAASAKRTPKPKAKAKAASAKKSTPSKKPAAPAQPTGPPVIASTAGAGTTAPASPAPPTNAGATTPSAGTATGPGSAATGGTSAGGGSAGDSGADTTGGSSTGSTGGADSGAAAAWPAEAHIETWAYDDCGNGGAAAGASVVRAWVTFAEANCGPAGDTKTLRDCHSGSTVFCDVIQYLDTNWIYPNGSPPWQPFSAAASESWYQHTPGSSTNRVLSTGYGGGYLINQKNPAVQTFFQNYVRSNYNSVDGLMMDDQSTGLNTQLYYSSCGCSSTNEVTSDADLRASHTAMSAAMTHSDGQPFLQIDNSIPANPYLPQGLDLLNQPNRTTGLIAEGEPEYDGTLDPFYSTLLDEIAYVGDRSSGFVVPLSYAPAGASYEGESRRVQEATMLLGYSPGHLVDWANLETGSGDLAVWPEEGIYPTDPVESMGVPGGSGCLGGTGVVCSRGGHNDLEVAPGVYRREFGDCYEQGASFGPCAAIVNTTSGPVTVRAEWLSLGLTHEITFSGGDVQSGGTVNVTGAAFTPGTTTVPAKDAILLAS